MKKKTKFSNSEEIVETKSKAKEPEKKDAKGFNPDDIKLLSKPIDISLNETNKVVIQKIEYKETEYLSINKFFRKKDSVIWMRGKGFWLDGKIAREILTKGLALFK